MVIPLVMMSFLLVSSIRATSGIVEGSNSVDAEKLFLNVFAVVGCFEISCVEVGAVDDHSN